MPEQEPSVLDGFKKLITEITEKEGFENYETEYKSISTEGANYMGSLHLVDIKEGERELNLFVKVSNTPEKTRELIKANEVYRREVFAYTTLASVFADLETKHAVPEEHRYKITKYYGSDLTELEEVIVLENIAKDGYVLYDRFKSVDWEYAAAAIEKLAKFHALSYALKKENPEKFDELIKSKHSLFVNEDTPIDAFKDYVDGLIKIAAAACDEEYVEAFLKFCKESDEFYFKQYRADEYSVLAHADYRPSNLLVKYEEGSLKSLIPVDYQTIFYGSPINDLLYFLFLGSDQQFRNQHYEPCIQHYYDSLAGSLARLSLDIDEIYPRDVFDQHLREKLLYGLLIGVYVLPVVLVASADAPKVESIFETGIKTSGLYNDRFREIVQDMVKWGVLKV